MYCLTLFSEDKAKRAKTLNMSRRDQNNLISLDHACHDRGSAFLADHCTYRLTDRVPQLRRELSNINHCIVHPVFVCQYFSSNTYDRSRLRGRSDLIIVLYAFFLHTFGKKMSFPQQLYFFSIVVACETRLTENSIPPEPNMRMVSFVS